MTENATRAALLASLVDALGGRVTAQNHDDFVLTLPGVAPKAAQTFVKHVLEGKDPHSAVAAMIWDTPIAEVTKPQRDAVKRRLFGASYGARLACIDCKTPYPEEYMVHDEVWRAARMTPRSGRLCLSCLAGRLGSDLVAADFTDVPANNTIRAGIVIGRAETEKE